MYFWIGIFILFTLFFGYLGLIFALISLGFYFLLKTKIIYFKNSRFKGLNKETKRENFMLNLEEIVDKQISEDFDIKNSEIYVSIDCASSINSESDFTSIAVLGITNKEVFLIDMIVLKLEYSDMKKKCKEIINKYKPNNLILSILIKISLYK